MTNPPVSVTVNINGQSYTLRTQDSPQTVNKLAEVVDHKMTEIRQATKTVDSLRVAILAALNLADDLRRSRELLDVTIKDFQLDKQKLLAMIDAALNDNV